MSQRRWLSASEQAVWRSYLQVSGMLMEHLDRELRRDAGITHHDYQVLAMLSEAPDRRLRMSDLAAAAWASPSRISHTVDRLERVGWVQRQRAAHDRRSHIAVLTDTGYRKLTEIAPGHVQAVRQILFDPLDPPLLQALGESLDRAAAALRAQDG